MNSSCLTVKASSSASRRISLTPAASMPGTSAVMGERARSKNSSRSHGLCPESTDIAALIACSRKCPRTEVAERIASLSTRAEAIASGCL